MTLNDPSPDDFCDLSKYAGKICKMILAETDKINVDADHKMIMAISVGSAIVSRLLFEVLVINKNFSENAVSAAVTAASQSINTQIRLLVKAKDHC